MSKVYTVLGPIEPSDVGICDMHEHVLWNSPGWEYSPEAREHFPRPQAFEKIQADLVDFKSLGGGTIVDVSGLGLGRDVPFYADLSRETGVHIVACTGFWAERKILTYYLPYSDQPQQRRPPIYERDVDFLTDLMVHELTKGMGTTNVRAGVIKVGCDRPGMSKNEEATFRAAARASMKTGALITTHGSWHAERQAEVLEEEGADPSRVVIGHLDDRTAINPARDKELGKKGYNLGYDHIGIEPKSSEQFYAMTDEKRADLVVEMIEAGLTNQIVNACDTNAWAVGLVHRGTPESTYAHLLRKWVPLLKSRGVKDDVITTILVETPRRLLPF
jgi:phosphotriesterase-related protein